MGMFYDLDYGIFTLKITGLSLSKTKANQETNRCFFRSVKKRKKG